MSYKNLEAHYKTIFALVNHHGYSVSEIYDMYPFELEIYVGLLDQFLQEKELQNQ